MLSEAEWEYAARAGTQTAYSWGDDIDKSRLGEDAGIGLWGRGGPKGPIALFSANAFGLHAMHGNVWEMYGSG